MDWPKCEKCDGDGEYSVLPNAPEGRNIVVAGIDELPIVKCPKCNGTGERDLTADEAAEYLSSKLARCEIHIEPINNGYYFAIYWGMGCVWSNEGDEDDYPKLSKAFNAACRAVRSKGCDSGK